MRSQSKKERLNQYRMLKLENSTQLLQLKRLREAGSPEAGMDGRMDEETRVRAVIATNLDEMDTIQRAVEDLAAPMERVVLRMRYIDGDNGDNRAKWEDIALAIYGGTEENQMRAVYRLHGQALQNLVL